jgi:hypothetical protein
LIGHAAGLPDIEHHLNIVTSELDIADERLHDIIGFGEQLELIAFDAANSLTAFAEFEQGFRDRAIIIGKDMLAGFEVF